MGIGADIGKAVDAFNGESSGTTLDDFLSKFSSAAGSYVNTIDPLHTFDVQMKFQPLEPAEVPKETGVMAALKSLANSGTQALNNLANNMTGGIAGAIANAMKPGIMEQHDAYSPGKNTFMKYLAEACLLINADNLINLPFGSSSTGPLELNLSYYVQTVTIPQLKIEMSQTEDCPLGKFPINGLYVMPDNSNITMSILNTKLPLMEMIFYPWMREVALPYWSYETQPYTTATIIVDMNKHADIKYEFYGCRPNQIQAMQPTQEPDVTMTRDVSFSFDYLAITSKYKTAESILGKIADTAMGVAGAAGGMMNV